MPRFSIYISSLRPFYGLLILVFSFISCQDDSVPPITPKPFVRLLENQKLISTLLKGEVSYAILLPEDYDQTKTDYPVVYLLHGYGSDEKSWLKDGNLINYVDSYKSEITPMIYVMPMGHNSYFVNKHNGNYAYMDMIATELVPTIDRVYRTKKDKSARAVMGYSMGGYGALALPALRPDVFTVSVPLSMSFRNDEQYLAEPQSVFDYQWASVFGGAGKSGQARLTDFFKQHSPFHFFNTQNLSKFSGLKLLLDCGDDEETLTITNDNLHVLLRDLGISHEYRTRNGGHSFDYWKKSYKEALQFISNAVQGIPHPSEPEALAVGDLIGDSEVETIQSQGITAKIVKPSDYATSNTDYPVTYFIYDFDAAKENKQLLDLFSLYKNNIASSKIAKSIIVAISSRENVTKKTLADLVTHLDGTYRTKAQKASRIIAGNGNGGLFAAVNSVDNETLFNACFLFDAQLTNQDFDPARDVFYYLDITDEGINYKGYFELYARIRQNNLKYEYRVRQGSPNFQSLINGLSESIVTMNQKLAK